MNYLQRDLANGEKLEPGEISFSLKTVEFPTVVKSIDDLKEEIATFRSLGKSQAEKDKKHTDPVSFFGYRSGSFSFGVFFRSGFVSPDQFFFESRS